METYRCLQVFDEDHKFNPKFDENDKHFFEGTQVFMSVGQSPDYSYLPEDLRNKLEWRGPRIVADENGRTSIEWLFAGGDIIQGPDIIHGVANGHNAAKAIDEYLLNKNKK